MGNVLVDLWAIENAIAAYEKALSMVKDPVQKKRIETVLKGLK